MSPCTPKLLTPLKVHPHQPGQERHDFHSPRTAGGDRRGLAGVVGLVHVGAGLLRLVGGAEMPPLCGEDGGGISVVGRVVRVSLVEYTSAEWMRRYLNTSSENGSLEERGVRRRLSELSDDGGDFVGLCTFLDEHPLQLDLNNFPPLLSSLPSHLFSLSPLCNRRVILASSSP